MSNFSRDPRNDSNQTRILFSAQVLRTRVPGVGAETSFNGKSNSKMVDSLPRLYRANRESGQNEW